MGYLQDVLSLCMKVDPKMTECAKVDRILKGIADDDFQLLVITDCSTVADVVSRCRRCEQAQSRRITHSFVRLPNTSATSSCEADMSQPRMNKTEITKIVRRELEVTLPTSAFFMLLKPHPPWTRCPSSRALFDWKSPTLAYPLRTNNHRRHNPDFPILRPLLHQYL